MASYFGKPFKPSTPEHIFIQIYISYNFVEINVAYFCILCILLLQEMNTLNHFVIVQNFAIDY